MRLYSSSLPTLALLVNVVCFLMVLIFKSAVSVKLYNDCSSQNIAVDRKGRVYARDDFSQIYQNFTINSIDFSGKLFIKGAESGRFLCFNKNWKLVGSRKYRGPTCLFYEEMLRNGYTRYRSALRDADGEHRYIGFTKRGKVMKETREKELTPHLRKCLNFLKLDTDFDVGDHNRRVAGFFSKPSSSSISYLSSSPKSSSSHHYTKIRHRNHHHLNVNEIT